MPTAPSRRGGSSARPSSSWATDRPGSDPSAWDGGQTPVGRLRTLGAGFSGRDLLFAVSHEPFQRFDPLGAIDVGLVHRRTQHFDRLVVGLEIDGIGEPIL